MNKRIISGDEMRRGMISGINKLTELVSSTIGPHGRNVLIDNHNTVPKVTNDGITVINSYCSDDAIEDMGIKLAREISKKTHFDAGDGTTSSCVLANAMLLNGKDVVSNKFFGKRTNVLDMKNGMKLAVEEARRIIKNNSKKIDTYDDILNIATVASNNDKKLGKMFADAYRELGFDGVINVEKVHSNETYIEIKKGYTVEKGYTDPMFINDKKAKTVVFGEKRKKSVNVLICPDGLKADKNFYEILQRVNQANEFLLIFCNDVDESVLNLYSTNIRNNIKLNMAVVGLPGIQTHKAEMSEDLAIYTDAKLCYGTNLLGSCESFVINHNKTIIVGGAGSDESVKERIDVLYSRMDDKQPHYHNDTLKDRIGWLRGSIGRLYVGAQTNVEQDELFDRIDDTVKAIRAAIEEGVVPGAGYTYKEIVRNMSIDSDNRDIVKGFNIVRDSLMAPLKCVCDNANVNFGNIYKNMLNNDSVYDAKERVFNDIRDNKIVEPAKVVRCAIENAVSVTSIILTSNMATLS